MACANVVQRSSAAAIFFFAEPLQSHLLGALKPGLAASSPSAAPIRAAGSSAVLRDNGSARLAIFIYVLFCFFASVLRSAFPLKSGICHILATRPHPLASLFLLTPENSPEGLVIWSQASQQN